MVNYNQFSHLHQVFVNRERDRENSVLTSLSEKGFKFLLRVEGKQVSKVVQVQIRCNEANHQFLETLSANLVDEHVNERARLPWSRPVQFEEPAVVALHVRVTSLQGVRYLKCLLLLSAQCLQHGKCLCCEIRKNVVQELIS